MSNNLNQFPIEFDPEDAEGILRNYDADLSKLNSSIISRAETHDNPPERALVFLEDYAINTLIRHNTQRAELDDEEFKLIEIQEFSLIEIAQSLYEELYKNGKRLDNTPTDNLNLLLSGYKFAEEKASLIRNNFTGNAAHTPNDMLLSQQIKNWDHIKFIIERQIRNISNRR